MLAVAIAAILSSLAIPTYFDFIEKARVARTVAELNGLAKEIQGYVLSAEQYPDSLAQIGRDTMRDPWGNLYQYYRINCVDTVVIGRHDDLKPSLIGSAGLVLPASVSPPDAGAHVSFAVDGGDNQGLIHLFAQAGGGGAGGGGGPPCGGIGGARKDRFLVPINSDFDLYSMGKDGESVGPLTAKKSHDDVIRANDGGFYGLAANF